MATSAPQIEGAASEDGRGESIWDRFSREPGRIAGGDTPEHGVDHYHRMAEDVELMSRLGVRAYRFSVAWPRVYPDGAGQLNPSGLDFYDRLVDLLLEKGIEPWVCLYHWDLPQGLEDEGGWAWRGVVPAFQSYATAVARRLSDRVKTWLVLNEANTFTVEGYFRGSHAPGHSSLFRFARAAHHTNLAQAAGVRVLRSHGAERVGTAVSFGPIYPLRPFRGDHRLAERIDQLAHRTFLDPVMKGEYPPWGRRLMRLARAVRPGDMKDVHEPLDFIGANIYRPFHFERDPRVPFVGAREATPEDVERTGYGWPVLPDIVRASLGSLYRWYGVPIAITENGASYPDAPPTSDERGNEVVEDPQRWAFIARHVGQARLAVHDGVPLIGYFVWSLLDNFEWAEGYSQRFGIVCVERTTGRRVLKRSGLQYADVVSRNGLRQKDLYPHIGY